jgi:hypothetical protein
MNLPLNPLGLNHGLIAQNQCPIAMFLIELIISLINLPIFPLELSVAVHHVVLPLSIVVAVVLIGEFALALETILIELAEVGGVVGPLELSVDFVPVEELASKDCAVLP